MFNAQLLRQAEEVLAQCRADGLRLTSAESCTGGLISGLFTEIAGSSDVFERGFVTYSNEAKSEMLGVPMALIKAHGAVSPQVAKAMAMGALEHSLAGLAVAVTGIAGPGGGTDLKPVGLVCLAIARKGDGVDVKTCKFGDLGRSEVRLATVATALTMLENMRQST